MSIFRLKLQIIDFLTREGSCYNFFFKLAKSFADKMLSGDEMGENAYVIKRIFFIIQLDGYLQYFKT